ncbi:putative chromatin remodeling complex subunit [Phaeomoniella chlamydospora]|uniref:Putative chromatin remodeling complex subunit n=1 Tax=Phaeomoniella chlamydospora TaxID=158046 RepID=A0A0G2DUT4_PHACM|nr:putative chromatin remodeling complex subunit [Phaeomoniella chlamydospora]
MDLSKWMGRPTAQTLPEKSEESDEEAPAPLNGDDDVESKGDSDTLAAAPKAQPSPVAAGSSAQSFRRSYTDEEEEDSWFGSNKSGQQVSRVSSEVRVVVESINPLHAEEYKYLPGHFSVARILKKSTDNRFQDKYEIERESGEQDKVSLHDLLELSNARSALQGFQKMQLRDRRPMRKPNGPGGFVSWNAINIGESDSDKTQNSRRRSGLRQREAASQFSESDHEIASSSSETQGSASSASAHVGRRSRRLKLNGPQRKVAYEGGLLDDSEDELIVARPSKRRRSARSTSTRGMKRERSPMRKSQRTRDLPRKNMRERHEDEIYAVSETEEKIAPKYASAKEHFFRAPDDEFRRRHRQTCLVCHIHGDNEVKGPLVFCQGCSDAYHKICLGNRGSRDHLVTKVGETHFVLQCRRCIGIAHQKERTAPHLGHCTACKELGPVNEPFRPRLTPRQEQVQREAHGGQDPVTLVNPNLLNRPEHVLFRCVNCTRAWHWHHLPSRKSLNGPDNEDEEDLTQAELTQKRFEEYHRASVCRECHTSTVEIDTIVAWRPVDLDSYIPGYTVDIMEEIDKEYLIKWKKQSHFRDVWMPGAWVWGVAATASRAAFMKKEENQLPRMTTEDALPEDYLRVDIVFDVRYTNVVTQRTRDIDNARVREVSEAFVKYKGLGYEDALWEKPPRPEDTDRWADFKSAYEEWVLVNYIHPPNKRTLQRHLQSVRQQDFESTFVKTTQPSNLVGGDLMQYQIDGLNWIHYQWFKQQNAILADEMGLGKTIQVISFFSTMIQDHKCWPWLVVVPNSTCPNWRREIKKWAPSIRVVTYYGSATARRLAHDYELFPGEKDDMRAHIVVSSYEAMTDDAARRVISKISWQGVVVDEGQRLKSDRTQFYEALSKIRFPFKLLLTGTPLQNNARELFNLLQFLDPKIDAAKLEQEYEQLNKDKVAELHELIRPFFLRRTKVQVLTFLPPVAQIILPVTMTTVQKKVYKSILAKNPQLMKAIFSRPDGASNKSEKHSLNNILMQLRKVLCHPFVYSRDIEERTADQDLSHRNLVDASAKLKLFEVMLPKLHERGHRVLLFSQFLDNLDIMEDFLDGLGLQHRRLDGSINAMEKQKRIDEFNAPDSTLFAFLLSTRAGGVGINLATADTVIIMDPDFNPHQDIQALSRAHRIGQQKKVLVFQLMTRNSAEEKIMQVGKRKMALDHVLIQQLGVDDDAGMDLESILKHGAAALFDENAADDDIIYTSASVDALLDRSQIENTDTGEDKTAESQFSFARVWVNDKTGLEDGVGTINDTEPAGHDPNIWDKIMQEREKAFEEEQRLKAQALGRGKRKRQNVDYNVGHAQEGEARNGNPRDDDTDFEERESEDDSMPDEDEVDSRSPRPSQSLKLKSPIPTPSRPKIKGKPKHSPKSPKPKTPTKSPRRKN